LIEKSLIDAYGPTKVINFLRDTVDWKEGQPVEELFRKIDLVPSIELGDQLQHALLWLYIRTDSEKTTERSGLDQQTVITKLSELAEENCIGIQILKPLRRPMQLIVTVRYKETSELERLLYEIRNEKVYTQKIECHVVYGQLFLQSIN